MSSDVRWHLELGGDVVARIDVLGYGFPFTYGRLVDTPAFERFRLYFTDPEGWPDEGDDLERLCAEVSACGRYVLRDLSSGVAYGGVWQNHDGENGVWFRHGDRA